MLLIIWDRLFGTFAEERPEVPPVYGLTKPLERPHHPVHILMHEWVSIASDMNRNVPLKTK